MCIKDKVEFTIEWLERIFFLEGNGVHVSFYCVK